MTLWSLWSTVGLSSLIPSLDRLIQPFFPGMLTIMADFLGAIGSGTGILLAVGHSAQGVLWVSSTRSCRATGGYHHLPVLRDDLQGLGFRAAATGISADV